LSTDFEKLNIFKKNNNYPIPLFSEENFLVNNLLSTKNYDIFTLETNLDSVEDVFFNIKYQNYLYFFNYKYLNPTTFNFSLPISYTQILDSFTANYEEIY
jgi:hypothetical protein